MKHLGTSQAFFLSILSVSVRLPTSLLKIRLPGNRNRLTILFGVTILPRDRTNSKDTFLSHLVNRMMNPQQSEVPIQYKIVLGSAVEFIFVHTPTIHLIIEEERQ
jgi:hypothetical protein